MMRCNGATTITECTVYLASPQYLVHLADLEVKERGRGRPGLGPSCRRFTGRAPTKQGPWRRHAGGGLKEHPREGFRRNSVGGPRRQGYSQAVSHAHSHEVHACQAALDGAHVLLLGVEQVLSLPCASVRGGLGCLAEGEGCQIQVEAGKGEGERACRPWETARGDAVWGHKGLKRLVSGRTHSLLGSESHLRQQAQQRCMDNAPFGQACS